MLIRRRYLLRIVGLFPLALCSWARWPFFVPAQSLVAASIVGKPQLLTPEQETDLMALSGPQHRVKMMENE